MRRGMRGIAAACTALLAVVGGGANAAPIDTVDWAADGTLDGTGTGSLRGGSLTVSYTTIAATGNAGITVGLNWNASLATNDAVMNGATQLEAGVLGTLSGTTAPLSFLQTVGFSANVIDPILYVAFADANTRLDFGARTLTLLDSNNAQLVGGSIVTFGGAANGFADGFAARINGTFGPGTPLQFNYLSQGAPAGFDSLAFSIGLAPVAAVPEPSTFGLLAGLIGSTALWRRRGAAAGGSQTASASRRARSSRQATR